jgi:hypothetical protein
VLTDEERIRVAAAEIEKIFPGSSDLIEYTATVAGNEPALSRGSYAAFAPAK